jgi:hypothetical protein
MSNKYIDQELFNDEVFIDKIPLTLNTQVMSSVRTLYLFNGHESFISRVFIRSGKFIKRLVRNVKRKS